MTDVPYEDRPYLDLDRFDREFNHFNDAVETWLLLGGMMRSAFRYLALFGMYSFGLYELSGKPWQSLGLASVVVFVALMGMARRHIERASVALLALGILTWLELPVLKAVADALVARISA